MAAPRRFPNKSSPYKNRGRSGPGLSGVFTLRKNAATPDILTSEYLTHTVPTQAVILADTGWLTGSSFTADVGTWTNTANIYTDDGTYATASRSGAGEVSAWIGGFTNTVPSGAYIRGIEIRVNARITSGTLNYSYAFAMDSANFDGRGAATRDFYPATADPLQVRIAGGGGDVFGGFDTANDDARDRDWADTDFDTFNAYVAFGFAGGGTKTVEIDSVQYRVTYTTPSAAPGTISYNNPSTSTNTYAAQAGTAITYSNTNTGTNTYAATHRSFAAYSNTATSTNTYAAQAGTAITYSNTNTGTNSYTIAASGGDIALSYSNTATGTNTYAAQAGTVTAYSNTATGTNTYAATHRAFEAYSNVGTGANSYTIRPITAVTYSNTATGTNTYAAQAGTAMSYSNTATGTNTYAIVASGGDIALSYSNPATGTNSFSIRPITSVAYANTVTDSQRRNRLLNSQNFTINPGWTATRATVVPNAIVFERKGQRLGSKLVEDTSNNNHILQVQATPAQTSLLIGDQITFSVIAKAGERTILSVEVGSASFFGTIPRCDFNLVNGNMTFQNNISSSSATDLGNGWWLCTTTTNAAILSGNNTTNLLLKASSEASSSRIYIGDGVSGLYLAQAQINLNQGARDIQLTVDDVPYDYALSVIANESYSNGSTSTNTYAAVYQLALQYLNSNTSVNNVTTAASAYVGYNNINIAGTSYSVTQIVEITALYTTITWLKNVRLDDGSYQQQQQTYQTQTPVRVEVDANVQLAHAVAATITSALSFDSTVNMSTIADGNVINMI